jgi:hypothetical protein
MATDLNGPGLMALLSAERKGIVLLQNTGVAPLAAAGIVGSIAIDSKSKLAYFKVSSTVWTQFAGISL